MLVESRQSGRPARTRHSDRSRSSAAEPCSASVSPPYTVHATSQRTRPAGSPRLKSTPNARSCAQNAACQQRRPHALTRTAVPVRKDGTSQFPRQPTDHGPAGELATGTTSAATKERVA